jgi:hypothetical protein
MKAISLWQSWASLIVTGAKKIETRSWRTNVRGTVAIHATKKVTIEAIKLLATEVFQQGLKSLLPKNMKSIIMEFLPRGAIIGTVEIIGCLLIVTNDELNEIAYLDNGKQWVEVGGNEYHYGDYTPDRYAWMLTNPVIFDKPIPAKGSQGFWNWDGDKHE